MAKPVPLRKGPKFLRKWSALIAEEIIARTALPGIGTMIQQGPDGRAINAATAGSAGGSLHPWKCIAATPPEGESGPGWVKVHLHSMVRKIYEDPVSKVTVTGLDSAFKLDGPKKHVWLKGDVLAMADDAEAEPVLTIENGAVWGGKFPSLIEWNTDDGSLHGSTGTRPEGHVLKQKAFYVPIAYTVNGEADPFTPLAKNTGLDLGGGTFLVQQARNHLVIGTGCIGGAPGAIYAQIDLTAAQPED